MNAVLDDFRAQIDQIDNAMVGLLAKRFEITKNVAIAKKKHGLQAIDPHREERQLKRLTELAIKRNVDPDLVCTIIRQVIDATVKNHKKILS